MKKSKRSKRSKESKKYKYTLKKKVKNTENNFKTLQCSPSRTNVNNNTCYLNHELIKFKNIWNIKHPDIKINDTNPRDIWNNLKDKMRNVCNEESCWLKQLFINNNTRDLLNYVFAPISPTSWKLNINEWLSSIDIQKVMKQWEEKVKTFVFLGPSPIDFDDKMYQDKCVWKELCSFDLKNYLYNKGKNKIGIIFNLDPHYKNGSHWVSLFINIKQKFIFYFDSNGTSCPSRILKFVKRVQIQGKDININLKFHENSPIQHQKENTECGIYSLYFIIEMLTENKKPEYFKKVSISDKEMENYRHKYFNII